jgi:cilia- and flagella-associated protein 52
VIVWDLDSRERVYDLFGLRGAVTHVEFTPDGRFIAAAAADGQLVVWDMQTGEQLSGLVGERPVDVMCWGPVDTSGRRPTYSLFVVRNGVVKRCLLAHDMKRMGYNIAVADLGLPGGGFSRTYASCMVDGSGESLLLGTATGELVVFSTRTGLFRGVFPVCSGGVTAIGVAPNGSVFLAGGDGSFREFRGADMDWTCANEVSSAAIGGAIVSVDFSSSGSWILVGTANGRLLRVAVDHESHSLTPSLLEESHTDVVTSVSFGTARADVFVTGSSDGTVRVWDLNDYRVLQCSTAERTSASTGVVRLGSERRLVPLCVWMDDEGDGHILTGWSDGQARCFRGGTGEQMWRITAHKGGVRSIAVRRTFFVTGGDDGRVCVWAKETRELLFQYTEHSRPVVALALDHDKLERVYSLGEDRTIIRFDLKSERVVGRHALPRVTAAPMTCLAQRQHGEQELVSGGSDGKVLCWDEDVPTRPVQGITTGEAELLCGVNAIAVSPTGRFLALALADGAVRVVDAASLDQVADSRGHSSSVLSIAWSPDERQVVSVGDDCCIAVHNFFLAPASDPSPTAEEEADVDSKAPPSVASASSRRVALPALALPSGSASRQ